MKLRMGVGVGFGVDSGRIKGWGFGLDLEVDSGINTKWKKGLKSLFIYLSMGE